MEFISLSRFGQLRAPFPRVALAACLLALSFDAAAFWNDQLELFAAETVTEDSNVFRISKDRDPRTFLGASEKSDSYTTTSLGFNLDIPVSRQRFQAGTSWNQVRYRRFGNLDFTGHDGHAVWLWQVGDGLSGQLGYTETTALASFANFQGRSADPLKTQREYANAAYMLSPSWQLQGGVARQTQRNELTARQDNDVDVRSADLAVNYVSAANNKIGISLRQQDGSYPHPQLVSGSLFDNGYSQHSVGLVTDWTITGKSHLAARIDRVRRSYDQLGQRDFEGTTFNATYDLKATGKFSLTAVAQRDISAAEDIQTSFVLIKGVALRPSFDWSDKIKLSGTADYSIRDYLGDPGLGLGTTAGRSDRVRTLGAAVSYKPLRPLTVMLSAQHETRTSNVALTDYSDNIVSLNARLAF